MLTTGMSLFQTMILIPLSMQIIGKKSNKNYLFVYMNARENYYETLRPYGAVRFVTFEGKPAQIPQKEIEAIRRLVKSELSYDPHPYLTVGSRVVVNSGPLAGCEGILIRKKGADRIVLSVNLLQQSVSAELDADWIERV